MRCMQRVQQIEKCLLVHRLRRAGDVAVAVLERFVGLAARPQQLLERRRKQIAELRRAVIPLIGNSLPVMAEKAQIERVTSRRAASARSGAWPPMKAGRP